MRQETNNEMDLLLRRLGRRQETAASTDHLDADELSSYAENVLPPAARARYTEHLAECARCRELVVQLSSSAGVVVAQETAMVSAPSALRKFLASLFSPMVLRYAVPALGLVVVAAIGFIVSRQQPGASSPVAQVTQQEQAKATVPASEPQQSSSPAGFASPTENAAPANKRIAQSSDTESGAAPAPDVPPTVSTKTTEVEQDAAAKKVEQQPAAKEVAAAPKPATASDDLKKLEAEAQKQKAAVDRVAVANEPPPAKTPEESKREDNAFLAAEAARSRPARKRAEPSGVAAVAGSATSQRDEAGEKDKNDADTRTVAGRRFRKQGNVWIDTAYNSSSSTVNLKRDSEQFRALVADEPAIKTIADQLDGEVIVVWKGRTYRIR
jgi:Putative zinc-finger